MMVWFFSKKAAVFEVVLDNDIRDGVKDKSDIIGIGGTCEMSVNFFSVLAFV